MIEIDFQGKLFELEEKTELFYFVQCLASNIPPLKERWYTEDIISELIFDDLVKPKKDVRYNLGIGSIEAFGYFSTTEKRVRGDDGEDEWVIESSSAGKPINPIFWKQCKIFCDEHLYVEFECPIDISRPENVAIVTNHFSNGGYNNFSYHDIKLSTQSLLDTYGHYWKVASETKAPRQNQIDKQICQAVALTLWHTNPDYTIEEIRAHYAIQEIAGGKNYPGKNTLRDWLGEIDPRPQEAKRGRKKKLPADAA